MSTVPPAPSARIVSIGGVPAEPVSPLTWTRLFVPVARTVILPPGPAAAASSKERSWPVFEILMAVPVGMLLCTLILPPALLLRIGTPPFGVSFDETLIVALMLTVPLVVLRFTLPPVPLGGGSGVPKPVVAVMGLLTVIAPVALRVNVPPSPTGMVLFGLLPPLNVTEPWMLSAP